MLVADLVSPDPAASPLPPSVAHPVPEPGAYNDPGNFGAKHFRAEAGVTRELSVKVSGISCSAIG